jgi:hypothetical protein
VALPGVALRWISSPISANLIGTNASGTADLGNEGNGVASGGAGWTVTITRTGGQLSRP